MATPYRKPNSLQSQPVQVKGSWFAKHKTLVVVSLLIVTLIAWVNSDYWPWPSSNRINERFEKVIDTCVDNEGSSDCKKIQKRYGMTFRYCHSLSDMNKTKTVYFNGKAFEMPYFPWYSVAWEGTSSQPPDKQISVGGSVMTLPSTYYGCQEHQS